MPLHTTLAGYPNATSIDAAVQNAIRPARALSGFINSGELSRFIAYRARFYVIQRTRSGLDVKGRPFLPYTPPYAMWKIQFRGTSGDPDLFLSGNMLFSLQAFPDPCNPLRASIGFKARRYPYPKGGKLNTEQLAKIHNTGQDGMPRRHFMGWRAGSTEDKWLRDEAHSAVLSVVRMVRLAITPYTERRW